MEKRLLVLTTAAFMMFSNVMAASAQQSPGNPAVQQPNQQQAQAQSTDEDEPGMMGRGMMDEGGMMRRGMMMGKGGMSYGRMAHRGMMGQFAMRMIFALMDSDGDGTISLQEFQAAHEKIFRAMDTDHDGTVSFEEMLNFMRGRGVGKSASQQ
jgi:hypothetical protein